MDAAVKAKEKKEYLLVFLLGIAIIFGFLILSGTLFSGYHFVDDHEVVRMEYNFKVRHQPLTAIMYQNIQNDLNYRFRPFYWVERSIVSYVFGSDMILWNIYTGIKGVLAFFLLYLTARSLKCNLICSLLFVGVTMLGQQIVPFYRSANQENTGLLLCAIVMWLIARQYNKAAYKSFSANFCFCIAVILCGLTKESFTLCIPAFAGAKYWLDYCHMQELQPRKNNWLHCLKKNWWVYFVTAITFLTDMYLIVFRVGTDKISYAGFHRELGEKIYIQFMLENLFDYLEGYTYLALAVALAVLMTYDYTKKPDRNVIRKYAGILFINLYVIGAQILTHAQSRIWERYLIPYMVSYAIIIVILGYRYFQISVIQKKIYTILLLLLILCQLPVGWRKAVAWTFDGNRIVQFLDRIIEESDVDSKIICSFSDEEYNLAIESRMETNGYFNIISYRIEMEQLVDLVNLHSASTDGITFETAEMVVCYNRYLSDAMVLMGVEQEQSEIYDCDGYAIIIRK